MMDDLMNHGCELACGLEADFGPNHNVFKIGSNSSQGK